MLLAELGLVAVLQAIFAITIIDLALSGDNAAVIGLAIRDLPTAQRKKAAIYGAGGAIVLRVIFTSLATMLMNVNYISAIGGLILVWITWKLVKGGSGEDEHVKASNKFWSAIGAIIIADLSMAFDNVMGVAGAAHGSIELVVFGLLLSIPILILGSNWLSVWMNREPFIIYIGAAVLAHTSLAMIFEDKGLNLTQYIGETLDKALPWAIALAVLVWGWIEAKKIKAAKVAVASAKGNTHK